MWDLKNPTTILFRPLAVKEWKERGRAVKKKKKDSQTVQPSASNRPMVGHRLTRLSLPFTVSLLPLAKETVKEGIKKRQQVPQDETK